MKTLKVLIKIIKSLLHTAVEALITRMIFLLCIACIVQLQIFTPETLQNIQWLNTLI